MTQQLPPEVRILTEDDIYRTSSQYRLWSFSPENLAALRRKTHQLAIERVERKRDVGVDGKQGAIAHGRPKGASDDVEVEYLTVEEELQLVQRYCEQIGLTCDHFKWPVNIKATAVQYLRRFYLSNSVLTYPPKDIYKTVIFLANKTEAFHTTLSDYARKIKTDPEQILAPEYKVMQALRFTLDVRQPFRGLKGLLMEMLNMAEGLPGESLQAQLQTLPVPPEDSRTGWIAEKHHLKDRIHLAYEAARKVLDRPAVLTDAYFLYTPSQILHAAMHIADSPLTDFYLCTKLPEDSPIRAKVLTTIKSCAKMMGDFASSQVLTKEGRNDLEAKLEKCRDPSTTDLAKNNAAMKLNGMEDGGVDEEKAKRKKLERAKSQQEGDDLFGPGLPTANGNPTS